MIYYNARLFYSISLSIAAFYLFKYLIILNLKMCICLWRPISWQKWSDLCKHLCAAADWAKAEASVTSVSTVWHQHSWPGVVLFRAPLVWVRLIVAFVVKHIWGNIMDLDARGVVEHLQILKNCLTDLLQVLQMHRRDTAAISMTEHFFFPLVNKRTFGCQTCLEFWFSILVLTSGCSVKSGAKYSKYSADNKQTGGLITIIAPENNKKPLYFFFSWN